MKQIRPRVVINSTAKFFFAQLIEDGAITLVGKRFSYDKKSKPVDQCLAFGEEFGKLVIAKKITKISYDRNGKLYHGRVKAFADGMRSAKLEF